MATSTRGHLHDPCTSLSLSGSFTASPIAAPHRLRFLQIRSPPLLPSRESLRRAQLHSPLRPFWGPSALAPQSSGSLRAPPPVRPRESPRSDPGTGLPLPTHDFRSQRGSLARATRQDLGIKTPRGSCPRNRKPRVAPPPLLESGLGGGLGAAGMTARGTPSRFLTSVLHNGLGRYVQQLQRLSFSLSRDAPSSRGAR